MKLISHVKHARNLAAVRNFREVDANRGDATVRPFKRHVKKTCDRNTVKVLCHRAQEFNIGTVEFIMVAEAAEIDAVSSAPGDVGEKRRS